MRDASLPFPDDAGPRCDACKGRGWVPHDDVPCVPCGTCEGTGYPQSFACREIRRLDAALAEAGRRLAQVRANLDGDGFTCPGCQGVGDEHDITDRSCLNGPNSRNAAAARAEAAERVVGLGKAFVEAYGVAFATGSASVEHEDGCPEDDTCNCPSLAAMFAAQVAFSRAASDIKTE